MPLVWELTAEIRNWLTAEKIRALNVGWRMQRAGHSDAVIDDFVSILQHPEMHYEAMLGYLETQFRRQQASAQEYHGLYSWLVELVYYLLYYRQVNNNGYLNQHLPFYDGIRSMAEANAPLWVFTLNHDVTVEAIAAHLSIPLHSGFSATRVTLPRRDAGGAKIGKIGAEVLTKHDLGDGPMHFPAAPQPAINLLKIHGALDIFTFNDGQDLLKILPEEPGQNGVIEVLRAANEDLLYLLPGFPGGRVKALNEIAYADENGVMQFLRRSLLAGAFKFDARGSQVLPQSMLRHFRSNLNFVSRLICIGYGFGDLHINATLRERLENGPYRHLEIVNPAAKEVPPFLLHLSPQVSIVISSATDYLDNKAGIVRSRRQKLEKRLSTALRSLGREGARKGFTSFIRQNHKRLAKGLLAKLGDLPVVNGEPDFGAIGDPLQVAEQWASEMKLDREQFLGALLQHLEKSAGTAGKIAERE